MERTYDDSTFTVEPVFADSFASMENWVTFAETSKWWVENGSLFGRWAEKGGGSNVWCTRHFEGDVMAEFRVRLIEPNPEWRMPGRPDGGKNINFRIHVTGPDGGDILAVAKELQETGTGLNRIGDDQYRGYFFTWTFRHGRLRRSPGYENVSENRETLPELGPWFTITVLFTGGRLRQFIDGRKIHDYADPEPFTSGKMGLALWHSAVEISDFTVFRVLTAR